MWLLARWKGPANTEKEQRRERPSAEDSTMRMRALLPPRPIRTRPGMAWDTQAEIPGINDTDTQGILEKNLSSSFDQTQKTTSPTELFTKMPTWNRVPVKCVHLARP